MAWSAPCWPGSTLPQPEHPPQLTGVAVGQARWVAPLPTPKVPSPPRTLTRPCKVVEAPVVGWGHPSCPPAHPLPTHSSALCPCTPPWWVWPESVVSERPQTRGGGAWGCVGGPQPIRSIMVRRDKLWHGQLCMWVGPGAEREPPGPCWVFEKACPGGCKGQGHVPPLIRPWRTRSSTQKRHRRPPRARTRSAMWVHAILPPWMAPFPVHSPCV